MTWKEWKKKIRAALDQVEGFDVETGDIHYLDLVDIEDFTLVQHKEITGLQSKKGAE